MTLCSRDMIEEALNSYGIVLDDIRDLIAELSDQELLAQTQGNHNHAAWVVGHLVCSAQAIGEEMGIAPWLSSEWLSLFGRGSTPTSEASQYPARSAVLQALSDAEARIVSKLNSMTAADLAKPLRDTRYREIFPTLGHAVLHILTVHTSVHLGQLVSWRHAIRAEHEGVQDG